MKYDFELVERKNIIQKYGVVGTNLVITYLDGHQVIMVNNQENLENFKNEMLTQALYRNRSYDLNALIKKRIAMTAGAGLSAALTYAYLIALINGDTNIFKMACVVFGISYSTACLSCIKLLVETNDEIKEIKKYDIYLTLISKVPNMKEYLDKNYKLNINTLDNFSLNDVIKIDKHLRNNVICNPDLPASTNTQNILRKRKLY